MRLSLVLFAITIASGFSAEWYVSPTGNPTNSGTIDSPLDAATAFKMTNDIVAGDTIYMRGGSYLQDGTNLLTCFLNGATNNPIVITRYGYEEPKITPSFELAGTWTIADHLEIYNEYDVRTNAPLLTRPWGIKVNYTGNTVRNTLISNVGHPGISAFNGQGPNMEIYGCVVRGAGLWDTDFGGYRGSGIYTQNRYGTKTIDSCVFMGCYRFGIKPYGDAGYINGYKVYNNVVVKCTSGMMYTSETYGGEDLEATGNWFYEGPWRNTDYGASPNINGHVWDNRLFLSPSTTTAGWDFRNWSNLLFEANYAYFMTNSSNGEFFTTLTNTLTDSITQSNIYSAQKFYALMYNFEGQFRTNLSGFQSYGLEIGTAEVAMPTDVIVKLVTNKYEPGRCNIAIFNWPSNDVVEVDLSQAHLAQGMNYRLRDLQSASDEMIVGKFDTNSPLIAIPMTNLVADYYIGTLPWEENQDPNIHTAPRFGVFLLEPRGYTVRQVRATTATVGTISPP